MRCPQRLEQRYINKDKEENVAQWIKSLISIKWTETFKPNTNWAWLIQGLHEMCKKNREHAYTMEKLLIGAYVLFGCIFRTEMENEIGTTLEHIWYNRNKLEKDRYDGREKEHMGELSTSLYERTKMQIETVRGTFMLIRDFC